MFIIAQNRPFASLRVTTEGSTHVLTFGLVFDSYICYTQPIPFKGICRGRFIAPTADSSALGGYFDTLHYPFNNKVGSKHAYIYNRHIHSNPASKPGRTEVWFRLHAYRYLSRSRSNESPDLSKAWRLFLSVYIKLSQRRKNGS